MTSLGADSEFTRFPSREEARGLVPDGRLPYVNTRMALQKNGLDQNRMVTYSIRTLARAHREGTLEPPLSTELAEAVGAADSFINEHGTPTHDFNHKTAKWILEAVFEHGYRSDSV